MATTSSSKRQLIHTSNTYESNSDLTVGGDLFVNGATTTIDTANLLVEDKNIIIGNVSSPSDTTADGGGITLKGASDYTINWTNSTNQWYFNQGINITGQLDVSTNLNVSGYGTLAGLDINGNSQFDGAVTVGVNDTGHDVKFFGATSGRYLLWDESANALTGVYDLKIADSRELQIGGGNDLRLYHSHPHSYIVQGNSGGSLYIRSHNTIQLESSDGEDMITCAANGAVTLHYDAASHLQTTSTGVNITGALSVDNVDFPNSGKARFGASDQLQIYHDGSNNAYIENSTSYLVLESDNIILRNPEGTEDYAKFFENGAVQLYYNNSQKFVTTNTGATITGNLVMGGGQVKFADGGHVMLGDSNDLRLYHSGSSYIDNITNDLIIRNTAASKDIIFYSNNGTSTIESLRIDGSGQDLNSRLNLHGGDSSLYPYITGFVAPQNPEGHHIKCPYFFNDLAYARLRGATVTVTVTGGSSPSNENIDRMLDASSYFWNQTTSGVSQIVITMENMPKNFTHTTHMGITFGNEGWRAKNVKLEAYYSGQWNTLKDVTNQTEEYVHIRHNTSSNSQTKLRWTLSNFASTSIRIASIYCYNYSSNGMSDLYVTRDGGSIYDDVRFEDNVKATFGDSDDLQIFHDGSNSYIRDNGTGGLVLEGSTLLELKARSGEVYFRGTENGAVNLYHDNGNRLTTISTGVYIPDSLGVGAATPSKKLHVSNGQSGFSGSYNARTTAIIESDNSAGTALSIMGKNTGNSAIFFGDQDGETVGQVFYNNPSNYLAFGASGATRAVLNGTGLALGLNHTDPTVNLDVEGASNVIVDLVTTTANANTTIRFRDGSSTETNKATIGYDGTNDGLILTTGGFTAGNGIFIDDNQNVGIGTSSPNVDLDLRGDMRLDSSGSTDRSIYFRNQSSLAKIKSDKGLQFQVAVSNSPAAAMTIIENDRYVGIGTTTPSRTLHVYDSAGPTIKFERGTASNLEFTFGSTNASIASAGEIQFRANGGTTNKFIINNSQIQSNAKFLVNTSSGIDVHTNDSGNILLSGNSSATGTPDQFFLRHDSGRVELGNNRGKTTVTAGDFQINTQFRLTSSGSGLTVLRHNGTNNYYENYTGNVHFFQHDADKSIYFHSDDGSGGTDEYYRVDGLNLRNVFSKGVDITGTLTTTATFGNRSTNQGINFETPTTALQTARVDSDAFRFYFGGTGGGQEVFRLEENGDLEVSGQIDSKNRKHKKYTSLTGSSGDWFPLFQVGDHHGGQVLFNINTYAHNSCTFIVSEGYGPSGQSANPAHISVLNYLHNANGGYAVITGIRVKQDGFVEIRLTWGSGPTVDIDVTAETSELVQYGFVSSLATSTNTEAVVDTALLENQRARFKKLTVNDTLYLPDGSESSPAIVGTNDTDTGIYWDSSNQALRFSTAGVQRGSFSSAGVFSTANVYSGTNGQFRNYSGVWKATTGTTGNGFQFISADATAMVLSSTGSLDVTNNLTANSFIQDGSTGNHFYAVRFGRSNLSESNPDMYGEGDTLILGADSDQPTLVIRDTENVGIGTASPAEKLEVAGNIAVRNGTYPTQIELYESFTDGSNYERTQLKFANGYFTINPQETGTGTQSGIDLAIGGTSKLKIEPEGNVLINGAEDNNNTADFAVATGGGDPTISWRNDQVQIGHNNMNWEGKVFENDGMFQIAAWARNMRFYSQNSSGTSALDFIFSPWDGSNLTERVRIKGNGKVGIGTNDPLVPLHVQGTALSGYVSGDVNADTMMVIENDDNARLAIVAADLCDVLFGDAADQDVGRIRYNHSANSMAFFTNGSEKVRIESGGDVGIGTTNPVQKLQAVGSIYANTGHFYVDNNKSLTSVGTLRLRTNNGTTAIIADTAQKVGLGCAAEVNSKASVFIKGEDNSPTLNGTAVDDASLILTNSYTTDPYGLCFGVNTSGTSLVQSRRLGSETYFKLALNPYGGNVGIGTDDPVQELEVDGVIKQKVYTVSTLPSAGSGTIGARAFVSDSYYAFSSSYLGSQISGGGSNFSPVYSDGNYWYMG